MADNTAIADLMSKINESKSVKENLPILQLDEAMKRLNHYRKSFEVSKTNKKNTLKLERETKAALEENIRADQMIAECYFNEDEMAKWAGTNHPILNAWESVATELMYSRPSYHFASLLPLLSMGLNRRVCLKLGMGEIYCNIDVMMAGITTISGKSWSSSNCIKKFGPAVIDTDYKGLNPATNTMMLEQSNSNASFCQDISITHNIFWYYNEAREFFIECDGWNKPMIKNLTGAYDGGTVSRKLSKRNIKDETNYSKCEDPFVSLLFNMTIGELKESCTGSLFSSGFVPRWLWFLETGGEMKKNVTATPEQEKRISEIYDKIYGMAKTISSFEYNSVIFQVNDDVESWKMDKSKKYGGSEDHQAVIGRGFVHIYKIAMIMAMYDEPFLNTIVEKNPTKDSPVYINIPKEWTDEAIKIYENYLFPRMLKVIHMSKVEDKNNKQTYLLEKLKELHGSATNSQLMRATGYNAIELKLALTAVIQSGRVGSVTKRTTGSDGKIHTGPKTTVYCLVPDNEVDDAGKEADKLLSQT